MPMRASAILWVASKVWMGLCEWLSTCFLVADGIARSIQYEDGDGVFD